MPSFKKTFGRDDPPWLRLEDMQGQQWTIRTVDTEIVKNEEKWVVRFYETDRYLVLNQLNGSEIAKQHGDNTDLWDCKSVILDKKEFEFRNRDSGEMEPRLCGVLRVPEADNGEKPKSLAPPPRRSDFDDEVPFFGELSGVSTNETRSA